jgi:predicted branched-subunit amino acid permease
MAASSTNSAYWKGFRDGIPFLLVVTPFALLFGVVATESGLNLLETMGFSIVVIAGASQFTALQLMNDNAPTLIVILSALAVNLRMAMYSASLTPYVGKAPLWKRAFIAYFMVDQAYAMSIVTYETRPEMSVADRVAYYFGVVTPIVPFWYLFTLIGAMVGQSIPPEMALDFAVPITFIAMIGPMLRTLPHIIAAAVSITLALGFAWVPYNLGLMIAALGAMIAGAQAELWFERKARA